MKKILCLLISLTMIFAGVLQVSANNSNLIFDLDLSDYDGTSATLKATNGNGDDVSGVILSGRTGEYGTDENTEGQIKYFIQDNTDSNKSKAALQMATSGDTKLDLGSNLTIDMWINIPEYSTSESRAPYLFTMGTESDFNILSCEQSTNDQKWKFYLDDGSGNIQSSHKTDYNTLKMPKNVWVKYTMVRSISGKNVNYSHYINGAKATDNSWSTKENWKTADYVGFGGVLGDDNSTFDRRSYTKYADVKIYNSALAQSEIQSNYNVEKDAYELKGYIPENGLVFDLDLTDYNGAALTLKATNGDDADISGVFRTEPSEVPVGTYAIDDNTAGKVKYFVNNNNLIENGGTSKASVQINVGAGDNKIYLKNDVTIDMWINFPSDHITGYPMMYTWGSTSDDKVVEAEYDISSGYFEYNMDIGSGKKATVYKYLSTNPFPTDEWIKYTVVRSVEDGKINYCYYINGVKYELGNYDFTTSFANGAIMGFGGRLQLSPGNHRRNYTKYADIKIYGKALTQEEIKNDYDVTYESTYQKTNFKASSEIAPTGNTVTLTMSPGFTAKNDLTVINDKTKEPVEFVYSENEFGDMVLTFEQYFAHGDKLKVISETNGVAYIDVAKSNVSVKAELTDSGDSKIDSIDGYSDFKVPLTLSSLTAGTDVEYVCVVKDANGGAMAIKEGSCTVDTTPLPITLEFTNMVNAKNVHIYVWEVQDTNKFILTTDGAIVK